MERYQIVDDVRTTNWRNKDILSGEKGEYDSSILVNNEIPFKLVLLKLFFATCWSL
jgi:hypothetical protein